MAPTSTAELELLDAATAAWGAFVRAVRATSLYDPSHPQVRPFVETFASGIRLCCTWGEPVIFTVNDRSLEVRGMNIAATTQFPPHLLQRMHHDGVRQLHFRSSFGPSAAGGLATALAPYTSIGSAPMEPLSDTLKWAALAGLTFVIHGRNSFVADPTTRAQTAWRARVLGPRPLPDREHLPQGTPLAPVWDGRRGRVPWPPPVDDIAIAELRGELEAVNHAGVPMRRVGEIIADIVEGWSEDPRLGEMLDVLASLVDGLLQEGVPDEASRLLQPMARWSERPALDAPRATLKRDVRSFLTLLASDSRLALLLEGVQTGRLNPEQVAAWFAALPSSELRHILRFATAVPHGAYRDRLLDVAAEFGTLSPPGLESVLTSGTTAEVLLALDTTDLIDDIRIHVTMGCRAMDRPEPAIVARGARLVSSLNHPAVREKMTALLRHRASELRTIGLRYVQRFKVVEAAHNIEELATSAYFAQMQRPERILIGLAFGSVGGARAAEVARRQLGEDWEYVDVERAAPWVLCLACSGARDAARPLNWLEDKRLPGLSSAVTDARNALMMSQSPGARR